MRDPVPVTPSRPIPTVPGQPFQLGYATTDLDRARAAFAEDLGISEFLVRPPAVVEVTTPSGKLRMELQLAFAFLGDTQIELIQPVSGDVACYADVLPSSGYGTVLHHLGFVVGGELSAWDDVRSELDRSRHPLLFEGAVEDDVRFAYLDSAPVLGHHLEYIWWSRERLAWLDEVPRHGAGTGYRAGAV
jgi:hypothetical protein